MMVLAIKNSVTLAFLILAGCESRIDYALENCDEETVFRYDSSTDARRLFFDFNSMFSGIVTSPSMSVQSHTGVRISDCSSSSIDCFIGAAGFSFPTKHSNLEWVIGEGQCRINQRHAFDIEKGLGLVECEEPGEGIIQRNQVVDHELVWFELIQDGDIGRFEAVGCRMPVSIKAES